MSNSTRPICTKCGKRLALALPPGGRGQRTLRCIECDGPDPLKSTDINGWMKGDLKPPDPK